MYVIQNEELNMSLFTPFVNASKKEKTLS